MSAMDFENDKSEAQIESENLAQLRAEQYQEDIRSMLTSDFGRRFLKEFFTWCDILAVYSAQNSGVYFHEGHRNCGKKIWTDMCEADPEEAARFQVELTLEKRGK